MKKKYNIFNLILSIIEIIFILPALILENLSKKKMGVIRYLILKRRVFIRNFNTNNLIIYKWYYCYSNNYNYNFIVNI
ncbi:hypothetical protein C1145_09895, partial [Clostridium botulinum]